MTAPDTGVLVLVATPIGALGDASPRMADELVAADVVAAEDTRRFARLRSALGVETTARVVSYFEGNEQRRTVELLEELRAGSRVVLVTDAGMPGISDPGYRLVDAALAEGIAVTAVPGPSAVTTALALSGLPVDRFCFEGFLPRRAGERARRLLELADESRTLVFFEAPHRLAATVGAMRDAFGASRRAAVCRELTKVHEEVRRGSLDELAAWAEGGVRGEITVVVAGADPMARSAVDDSALVTAVEAEVATGSTRRAAVDAVAERHGLSRRVVYAAVNDKSAGGRSLG